MYASEKDASVVLLEAFEKWKAAPVLPTKEEREAADRVKFGLCRGCKAWSGGYGHDGRVCWNCMVIEARNPLPAPIDNYQI